MHVGNLHYDVGKVLVGIVVPQSGKHLRHVQAVQPNLIGVNQFVPKVAGVGARLLVQLAFEQINCLLVLGFAGFLVQLEKHTAFVDIIQVEFVLTVTAECAILEDVIVHKTFYKVEITLFACDFVEFQ